MYSIRDAPSSGFRPVSRHRIRTSIPVAKMYPAALRQRRLSPLIRPRPFSSKHTATMFAALRQWRLIPVAEHQESLAETPRISRRVLYGRDGDLQLEDIDVLGMGPPMVDGRLPALVHDHCVRQR